MLALHGSWLPAHGARPSHFHFWAEFLRDGRPPRPRAGAGRTKVPRHPFAATPEGLRAVLIALGVDEDAAVPEPAAVVARLPSTAAMPLPSPEMGAAVATESGESVDLSEWQVAALAFDAGSAVEALLSLGASEPPRGVAIGADLRFWVQAARLLLANLYRQQLIPILRDEAGGPAARWHPTFENDATVGLNDLTATMPPVCRALSREPGTPPPSPRALLAGFVAAGTDVLARQALAAGDSRRERSQPRGAVDAWFRALGYDPTIDPRSAGLATFREQYRRWTDSAAALAVPDTFRLCFRLDPPLFGGSDRPGNGPIPGASWTLQYLLQATDDPSLLVSASDVWRERGATARFLDRRLDHPQERLLAGLGRAARLFPPIEESLRQPAPNACDLTTAQAFAFVREAALLLTSTGFGVLLPGLERRLGVRLQLGGTSRAGSSRGVAGFGWDSVVSFDWKVAAGDAVLTADEFRQLVRLKEPLVQVRGQWVELKPELVEKALAFFDRHEHAGEMAIADALHFALAPDGDLGLPVEAVETAGAFDDLLAGLRDAAERERIEAPDGFEGTLRPYQQTGVSWLATLRRHGLGACLADDMGLGKSPQTIALLLHQRNSEPDQSLAPALIVCPTSVVGNWQRELARFAPSLRVLVHHGAERNRDELTSAAAGYDVVLSTYALLHRDAGALGSVEWSEVVLDEAQNIKNPSTKAAQAARSLPSRWRAALTGTPVENRLSDLWSIFQFLNPGYLGSAQDFRRRFANPIERLKDESAAQHLQQLVRPFILRRLKTDRSVIADLPEKNEMKVFCSLTAEQVTLYQAVLEEQLRLIDETDGVQRRGQVLATLTKLKQICNHPALFLHDGSRLDGRSGKLERIAEMAEELVSAGDHALIFTQYAEMGRLLQGHLAAAGLGEVPFLHGGTPAPTRNRMVDRFQNDERGPQLFILSLKAGGTGLNLTRANHVFHFDRWWNPAVENQATDRAFRIGQRRDVQVHKYLCAGTFEETLDGLIEQKQALAEAIVGAGESWITEMSTSELRDLFTLRRDIAVGV
ncbi:MAG: DEAD/DEAH box helicase [Dehalococcoidia bacterium]